MLCEGDGEDKTIIDNQLKKINFYDLLETITNLIKIITNSNKFDIKSFYKMVKNYENSVFNEEQYQLLNIALKLFIYLNKIKKYNVTLLHLLEKKRN